MQKRRRSRAAISSYTRPAELWQTKNNPCPHLSVAVVMCLLLNRDGARALADDKLSSADDRRNPGLQSTMAIDGNVSQLWASHFLTASWHSMPPSIASAVFELAAAAEASGRKNDNTEGTSPTSPATVVRGYESKSLGPSNLDGYPALVSAATLAFSRLRERLEVNDRAADDPTPVHDLRPTDVKLTDLRAAVLPTGTNAYEMQHKSGNPRGIAAIMVVAGEGVVQFEDPRAPYPGVFKLPSRTLRFEPFKWKASVRDAP